MDNDGILNVIINNCQIDYKNPYYTYSKISSRLDVIGISNKILNLKDIFGIKNYYFMIVNFNKKYYLIDININGKVLELNDETFKLYLKTFEIDNNVRIENIYSKVKSR